MPSLLHLDSSADLTGSVSRQLTARFAKAWSGLGSDHVVVRRDLHTDPLPHLPTNALHWAPRLRTPDETASPEAEALQQSLIGELVAADAVVIGAPLYNWSMPSTLKAWIDYIQVGGTTSTFDEPSQPMAGKPVLLVSSRGAEYGPGTPGGATDHEIPALQQVLGVALGMAVYVVTAQLTLARRIPAMAGLIAKADADLSEAQSEIDRLAVELGSSWL